MVLAQTRMCLGGRKNDLMSFSLVRIQNDIKKFYRLFLRYIFCNFGYLQLISRYAFHH